MAEATYKYHIATEFPNAAVDPARLSSEVQASPITVALASINTGTDGYCNVVFKTNIVDEELTALDGLVAAHSGQPLIFTETVSVDSKATADGRLRVAVEKSDQTTKTFYTHNWCDKTTWYEAAIRVENEQAVDSGDQTRFELANKFAIDNYHGKISKEDGLVDSDGYSYRIQVTVDGYAKTEQDPHYGTGGDFTVNYADGYIDFLASQTADADVRVNYHYATSSILTIVPDPGKILTVELAEVQFSSDVELTDTVKYEAFGYVDVFAPHLTPVPFPPGTKIPIRTTKYKTMSDYQNDALKSYPMYPAIGGSSWRGMQQSVLILDWDYLRGNLVSSAAGMELRVCLEHHEPFGGSYATATFYCTVSDEE